MKMSICKNMWTKTLVVRTIVPAKDIKGQKIKRLDNHHKKSWVSD